MRWGSSSGSKSIGVGQNDGFARSTWGKALQTGEALANVAWVAVLARGKWSWKDYVAIGVKAGAAALNIYNVWAPETQPNLERYFTAPGSEWKICPYFASQIAFNGLEIQERIVDTCKHSKGGKLVTAAWTAEVDGVGIGWVGPPDQAAVPEVIFSKTPKKIRDLAARRMWDKAGDDQIVRIQGERAVPHYLPEAVVETDFLRTVEARARRFLDKGVPRALVMDGEPGVGKTTAAGHIARKLKFRTCVVNAEDFCIKSHDRDGYSARGVELVEILKPDVLVVNDIDRVSAENQLMLLEVFDNAKGFSRLIFATTNHYRALMEPVRRPGRLDDIIHVPGLTVEEIRHVAPAWADYAERMRGWPIAYVADLQERFNVLGEEAYAEFEEVARRLQEVREDGNYISAKSVEDVEDAEDAEDEMWKQILATACAEWGLTIDPHVPGTIRDKNGNFPDVNHPVYASISIARQKIANRKAKPANGAAK